MPFPKIHHVVSSSPITDMFTSPPVTPAVSKPLPIIQTSPRVPASSTEDDVTDVSALSAVVTVSFPTSSYMGFRPSTRRRPRRSSRTSCQGILTSTRSSLTSSLRHSASCKRPPNTDPSQRLNANGAVQVQAHPPFAGVDWDKVTASEETRNRQSTSIFEARPHSCSMTMIGAISVGQSAATPGVSTFASSVSSTSTISASTINKGQSPFRMRLERSPSRTCLL